jgi:hypothetical protein
MMSVRHTALPYKDALKWLIDNDDCHWLDEDGSASSVTASLVADIYGYTDQVVRADLTKLWKKPS